MDYPHDQRKRKYVIKPYFIPFGIHPSNTCTRYITWNFWWRYFPYLSLLTIFNTQCFVLFVRILVRYYHTWHFLFLYTFTTYVNRDTLTFVNFPSKSILKIWHGKSYMRLQFWNHNYQEILNHVLLSQLTLICNVDYTF